MNSSKSYLTAIGRNKLPAPTKFLIEKGWTHGTVLDFGCGKAWTVNPPAWFNYDPYHYKNNIPSMIMSFDTIVCNYVLCTITKEDSVNVLKEIQKLLMMSGVAFITVRRCKPKQGWGMSSKGTLQRSVKLNLPIIKENSQFCIYLLKKSDNLAFIT
jgi:SAM-dependent methyltransferase